MRTSIKIWVVCMTAIIAGTLSGAAQGLKISEQGETTRAGSKVYVIPSTTIAIDLTIRHESIRVGEYARFAQRNFGVIAPLADKDIYSVESASISWTDSDTPLVAAVPTAPAERHFEMLSHTEPAGAAFARVLPDKVSASGSSTEDAARNAAATVYEIRKARLALIMEPTEGLDAALERLDKIENQYLELFLGKHSTETYTVRYYIVPERGRNTYIVCRMDEARGVLPVADLSGAPILLELHPEGLASRAYPDTGERKKRSGKSASGGNFVVADMVSCTVTDGTLDYATERIPVYQLGVTVSQ